MQRQTFESDAIGSHIFKPMNFQLSISMKNYRNVKKNNNSQNKSQTQNEYIIGENGKFQFDSGVTHTQWLDDICNKTVYK